MFVFPRPKSFFLTSETICILPAPGKQAELLQSTENAEDENRAYFIALVVVAVVAAVAGFGFVLLLVILVKRQASAKAPISRTPSESAYDNPTYKVSTHTMAILKSVQTEVGLKLNRSKCDWQHLESLVYEHHPNRWSLLLCKRGGGIYTLFQCLFLLYNLQWIKKSSSPYV